MLALGVLPKAIARGLSVSKFALYRRLAKLERQGHVFRPNRETWAATATRPASAASAIEYGDHGDL